jgi:hypothetical protein|tara:strand:+ start:6287 stop:7006 length:720 start_codon:yes stop_codon:yes gene_type:complete
MRDYLLDIVKHTRSVGNIDAVKVTDGITVEAKDDDNKVIVKATYKTAMSELDGVIGLPNLDKLNVILNIPEYKDNAKITVEMRERNGEDTPFSMKFVNAGGDFKNDFRFMSKELVTQKIPEVRFKGANWDVEVAPHSASVQRFKFQSQANSEENVFIAKTDGGALKFYFGDDSGHTGNFTFEAGVSGELKQSWKYPVAEVQAVLNLNGEITMRFADAGALKIDVDNGMAVYEYIFPAQS